MFVRLASAQPALVSLVGALFFAAVAVSVAVPIVPVA